MKKTLRIFIHNFEYPMNPFTPFLLFLRWKLMQGLWYIYRFCVSDLKKRATLQCWFFEDMIKSISQLHGARLDNSYFFKYIYYMYLHSSFTIDHDQILIEHRLWCFINIKTDSNQDRHICVIILNICILSCI